VASGLENDNNFVCYEGMKESKESLPCEVY